MSTVPDGIADARVSAWLADNIASLHPPFSFELISGGRSNLTYKVTDGSGGVAALRRPPLGQVLATAHDMEREHKILCGLFGTAVPVAEPLGLCTDVAVNDAPFYVMSHVDGVVCHDVETAETLTLAQRSAAVESLLDVLAALHGIEPDDVGLGDLGRRTGYVQRQLKRWSTQWENSKTRELPVIEAVRAKLESAVPAEVETSIAHGDYRIGNCALGPDGKVIAVFDWELCTLGDPRADIGYICSWWPAPAAPGDVAIADLDGFPDREAMAVGYSERTGRSLEDIAYFTAFAHWRLACIGEGVHSRFLHGVMGDQQDDTIDLDVMRDGVERRANAAAELLGLS